MYKILFHEIENILPHVRKGKTFEETLNEQNIRLLPIPEIEKTQNWEYKFLYSGISSNYTVYSLIYEMIPNEAKFIHNIQLLVLPNSLSWGAGTEFGLFVIYPGYIVCSPKFVNKNNEIFSKLKQELA